MGKRFTLIIATVASVIALSSCAAKSAHEDEAMENIPLLEDELVNISSSSINEANRIYDSKKFENANNTDIAKYIKQLINATKNPNNEDKLAPKEPSEDTYTKELENKYEGYILTRDLFYNSIIANSFYNRNYDNGLAKFCELDKEIYNQASSSYKCADRLMEFLRYAKANEYSNIVAFYRVRSIKDILENVGGEWVPTYKTLNTTDKNNKPVTYFEYKNKKTDKIAYSLNSSIDIEENEKYWMKLLELSIFKYATNSLYKVMTSNSSYDDNVSKVLIGIAKNSSKNFETFGNLNDFEKRNFPKIYANTEIYLGGTLADINDRISFKGECLGGNIETITDNANAKDEDAELEMGCTYYFNNGTNLKVLQQHKGGMLVQREPKNKRKDILEEPMFFIVTDNQMEECTYYNTTYIKYVGFYGYSPEGRKVYAFRSLNSMPANAKDINSKTSKKMNIDSTTIYK